jgi:HD-GYP domain-containing protein (c-di-GMP phosphodiesterase class II)
MHAVSRDTEGSFFPISPLMIMPDTLGDFAVYIKRENGLQSLYCGKDSVFTKQHMERLHDNGIQNIYIETSEKTNFESYTKQYLGKILNNETIPIEQRGKVFLDTSKNIVKAAFTERLPSSGERHDQFFRELYDLITNSLDFLCIKDVINGIGRLMSADYETYTHCIHVFVFSSAILRNQYDKETLTRIGMGSLLHDIGKTLIPKSILLKPDKLTDEEFAQIKEHPLNGVSFCTNASLSQEAYNIILYHHEKLDGSGYPSRLMGDKIPDYVRAVTISDIYDALISNRAYAAAMKPFEALRLMQEEFLKNNQIDSGMFKMFVSMLAGNHEI